MLPLYTINVLFIECRGENYFFHSVTRIIIALHIAKHEALKAQFHPCNQLKCFKQQINIITSYTTPPSCGKNLTAAKSRINVNH